MFVGNRLPAALRPGICWTEAYCQGTAQPPRSNPETHRSWLMKNYIYPLAHDNAAQIWLLARTLHVMIMVL
jgi:hypothetical protein